jgi:predicted phosphoadenosine phosphosulfate sulfurtransferase
VERLAAALKWWEEEGWKQHQNPGYSEEASDIIDRLSVPEYDRLSTTEATE